MTPFKRLAVLRADWSEMLRQMRRLEHVEAEVKRLETLEGQMRRIEDRLNSINRRLSLDAATLQAPHDLTFERFRAYSQNGEDGLSLAVFGRVGTGPGLFVDIGCGSKGGNAAFFAEELGWGGLMVDGREEVKKLGDRFPPGRVTSLATWVTRENVNELISSAGLSGEIDLLSVDVDGVDYWLWDAIDVVSPRVVICEYNSYFGPYAAVTVPYEPDFNRKRREEITYYGASLAGLVALGRRKGYRLVCVEPTGVNAYFARDDLAPGLPGFEAHEVFRRQVRHQARILKGRFDMARFVAENGYPLIDVSAEPADEAPAFWRPEESS